MRGKREKEACTRQGEEERMYYTKEKEQAGKEQTPIDSEKQKGFLQSVIDGVPHPLMVVGKDFRPLLANGAMRGEGRLEPEKTAQGHCYRLAFGRDRSCAEEGLPCPLPEVIKTGRPLTTEQEFTENGQTRFFEITAAPLWEGANTSPVGIIETFREITSQKQAERLSTEDHDELERLVAERTSDLMKTNQVLVGEIEERHRAEAGLRQAKEQADLVYRLIPSAIFTVDMHQRITSWNDKAEEVTGYSREEVLGRKCDVFALRPCTTRCGVFSSRSRKPIVGKECEIRTKDGQVRVISKNADLLRDGAGRVVGGIESFEDITDRNRVNRMLRSERDKFRSMLSAMGQGMHILNPDYDIEYQNEVLVEHFGDKIGHKCFAVYKQLEEPCEVCRMRQAIQTGEIQRTELLMANGRYYEQSYAPFRDVDGRTKVLILLRDITQEKAFQAETMRAGQLAAIGELAAGVAHEINNPINGIINYAQVLLDELEVSKPAHRILDRIIREGERISGIVGNLLSFARQTDEENEEVSLGAVIDEAVALIKHQFLKDGIQLAIYIEQDLPAVQANAQQLQQIFLNLLSNARYALNQRYPGKHEGKQLEIKSRLVRLEGKPYVRTTVTDYGTGIPEEIINHIFKPFYSLKKPGEGTGLGLSISHGLVKDFNGFLWADSKIDQYTTMTVDLPAIIGSRNDPA